MFWRRVKEFKDEESPLPITHPKPACGFLDSQNNFFYNEKEALISEFATRIAKAYNKMTYNLVTADHLAKVLVTENDYIRQFIRELDYLEAKQVGG